MNGSPLFTGDAGSGESEIRRWIMENDWLEAIVALPEQLFYNTGIPTYIWVLSNNKPREAQGQSPAHRRDIVLVADAEEPGEQAAGDPADQIGQITTALRAVQGGRALQDFPHRPRSATARSPSSVPSG